MTIMKGDKIFVLRYNDNFVKDSMEIHKDVCDKHGFCWYGKAGKKPNVERIISFIEDGTAKILFYSRQAVYIGRLLEVSLSAPEKGVPDYYADSMWKPNFWFRVTHLSEVHLDILDKLLVNSTGKTMKETINSTMTSFFFTLAKEDI